jgi:protein-tyrosine phosphatase
VTKRLLFICTGNFYRSRFAEAVFNFNAEKRKMDWRAVSRGLAIHWAEGVLSPYVGAALMVKKIPLRYTGTDRSQLTRADLEKADRCIALDRSEHFPMLGEQFPEWQNKVEYWEISDLPLTQPDIALPAIEAKVLNLLTQLAK